MPRPTYANTELEWAKNFAQLLRSNVDRVPPGFRLCNDWAKLWNLKRRQAHELLRLGMEKGMIETKKFRIQNGKYLGLVPHYRILKNPPDPRRAAAAGQASKCKSR